MNFLRRTTALWRERRAQRKIRFKNKVTAVKNRNAVRVLELSKLCMPYSSQTKLFLPYDCDEETFLTTKFTAEWAEGRITMQEIKEVLEELKKVEFYDPRKLVTEQIMKNRRDSLDRFLKTTDSKFIRRGLRLRAGVNGGWIVVEKVGPLLPESRVPESSGSEDPVPEVEQDDQGEAEGLQNLYSLSQPV